jgi:cytosine permease
VDYYLLRSHRKVLDDSRRAGQLPDQTPTIGWAAIVASIIGGVVGLVTEWGVPTINSLLAASLLYWAFKLAFSRAQKPAATL